jgi:hypothetical protein
MPLKKQGDRYIYDMEQGPGDWLNYHVARVAEILGQANRFPFGKPRIWSIHDKAVPAWFREMLEHTPVQYITEYPGEEANYFVLLTARMAKWHETYLVG